MFSCMTDKDGEWYRSSYDTAMFYPLLEIAAIHGHLYREPGIDDSEIFRFDLKDVLREKHPLWLPLANNFRADKQSKRVPF